jgi:hypothetical protein
MLRISKRLGVMPEDVPAMLDGIILPSRADNKRILGGEQPELIGPAQKLAEIMVREKMLANKVDASVAIDTNFTSCY